MIPAHFYQVNAIDDYNHFVGKVDIVNQLRRSDRFDHWMRKRKLLWSMIFCSFKCY